MGVLRIRGSDGKFVGIPTLRGERGPQGPQGPKGDTGNIEELGSLTPDELDTLIDSGDNGTLTERVAQGRVIPRLWARIKAAFIRKVNGKSADGNGNVQLSASDVGARADNWMPTAAQVGAAPSSHTHYYAASPTIGGAANSANSLNAIAIPVSSDLNSYTVPGFYKCVANSTAATLANCPTGYAFFMTVGQHAGTFQLLVEYLANGTAKVFYRNCYSNVWSGWKRIYTEVDQPPYPVTSVNGATGAVKNLAEAVVSSPGTSAERAEFTCPDLLDLRLIAHRNGNIGVWDSKKGGYASTVYSNVNLPPYTHNDGYEVAPYNYGDRFGFVARNPESNDRLYLYTSDPTTGMLGYYTYKNGVSASNGNIYTSTNKPTYRDVGAAAASHNHSALVQQSDTGGESAWIMSNGNTPILMMSKNGNQFGIQRSRSDINVLHYHVYENGTWKNEYDMWSKYNLKFEPKNNDTELHITTI